MKSPEILFEDNHLIAINKPFGMPSQGDDSGDLCAFDWVKSYLKEKYQKPGNVYTGLLHRIDRPTGGILLLAKTSKAAARLSDDFQKNNIRKTYYCITENPPPEEKGHLFHYLAKLPDKNIVKAYSKPVYGAKPAELNYEILTKAGSHTLVKVHPITGRQHQIRVQMASVGSVICGDVKYGKTRFLEDQCIALFAKELEFTHPVTKSRMVLSAPLPSVHIWVPFHSSGF
ncbi:MAG: RluA family pseudouridine synthase [Bacteroidia bacterium]|nr:RluA family pseudouridine synthase [Bacteroidia bacterium]